MSHCQFRLHVPTVGIRHLAVFLSLTDNSGSYMVPVSFPVRLPLTWMCPLALRCTRYNGAVLIGTGLVCAVPSERIFGRSPSSELLIESYHPEYGLANRLSIWLCCRHLFAGGRCILSFSALPIDRQLRPSSTFHCGDDRYPIALMRPGTPRGPSRNYNRYRYVRHAMAIPQDDSAQMRILNKEAGAR
ncbi:hypothetical protein BC826DRAFT_1067291 [Russula brevipes]|nr:hypothetical protein BC826DRAFT_1067291 [Russula brevipes]